MIENEETHWLEDVQNGEEVFVNPFDPNEKGAIPIEPFNLDEERKFGTFEDGFYVEDRQEKSKATDAWLSTSEATVCSIEVLRKHEKQQQELAAAESQPKPSLAQTMDLQRKIVAFLNPKETILMALRRLAKKSKGKDIRR